MRLINNIPHTDGGAGITLPKVVSRGAGQCGQGPRAVGEQGQEPTEPARKRKGIFHFVGFGDFHILKTL